MDRMQVERFGIRFDNWWKFWNFSVLYSAFATTTTSGVFTTEVIPRSDLGGSSWNKYVYRVYSGQTVDQNVCTTMCAFDFPNAAGSKCHFTVLIYNTCYLGTLEGETDVLAGPITGDLRLKTCKFCALSIPAQLGSNLMDFQMFLQMTTCMTHGFNHWPQQAELKGNTFMGNSVALHIPLIAAQHYATHITRRLLPASFSSWKVRNAGWETLSSTEQTVFLGVNFLLISMRVSKIVFLPAAPAASAGLWIENFCSCCSSVI